MSHQHGEDAVAHLVIQLDCLHDLFVCVEESADERLFGHELNVSDDGSSSVLGVVERLLNFRGLGDALELSVDMLVDRISSGRR